MIHSNLVSTFILVTIRCFILFTKLNLIIHLIILFYTKRKALSIQSKLFQFGLGCILSAAKFLASLAIAENLIVISAGTFCCIVSADEKCKEHNKGLGFRFDDDSKKNLNLPQPEPTSSSLGWLVRGSEIFQKDLMHFLTASLHLHCLSGIKTALY